MGMLIEHTAVINHFLAAMLHSVWIAGLFLIFQRLFLFIAGPGHIKLRYTFSLFSMFGIVSATILLYIRSAMNPVPATLAVADYYSYESFTSSSASRFPVRDILKYILFAGYMAGLAAISLSHIIQYFRLRFQLRNAVPADIKFTRLLKDICTKLAISVNVRLAVVKGQSSPSLLGYFKPVIIVPAGMLSHMPLEQIEVILTHELIHLKRNDFLINLFQVIAESLFFFNPFLIIISRQLRYDRELLCDDDVINSYPNTSTYIKALYNLGQITHIEKNLVIPFSTLDNKKLLNRINRILNNRNMKKSLKSRFSLGAFLLVGSILVLTLSGFSSSLFSIEKAATDKAPKASQIHHTSSFIGETTTGFSSAGQKIVSQEIHEKPDTVLTKEEKEELLAQLEFALQELKSKDWEKEIEQFRIQEDELKKVMEEHQKMIQEKLSSIDEETIQKEIQRSAMHLDSLKRTFNEQEWKEQLKLQEEMLIKELEAGIISLEQLAEAQKSLQEMSQMNLEQIWEDAQQSIENIDLDLDLNINIDSIQFEIQSSLQNMDWEKLQQEMEQSMKDMEKQIKELKMELEQKKIE